MTIEQVVTKLWELKGDGTITEMAEQAGMNTPTLWRIMHGERVPSGETLVQLMTTYPSLAALFLPQDMTSVTVNVTESKEAS